MDVRTIDAEARTTARLRHVPALDGLRGLAVAGVVVYHLDRLRGGYLGVDAFFVLSGFLITSLLALEWRSTGRIDLRRFWVRRARRLLPAVLVFLCAVVVVAGLTADPTTLGRLRAQALAALFYVANWQAIADGASYWSTLSAPSPLLHMWSLAIEEQFYVVWPLVVVAVLGWWRRSLVGLLGVTLGLAAVSAALMPLLHDGGDPTRVYFGTDTRMAAILYGSALALATVQWGQVRGRWRTALEAAAVVAGAVLALMWATVPGTADWLYRGGFVVAGLAVTVVIAAATHDTPGPVARLLAVPPLQFLGRISYGLYLWHWPVIVWLTPRRTGLDGWALDGVRVAVSLAVTLVSYRLLEQPIRHGALRGRAARIVTPVVLAGTVVVIVGATAGAVAPPPVVQASPPVPVTTLAPGDAPAVGAVGATGGSETVAGPPRLLVVGDSGAYFLGEQLALDAEGLGLVVRAAGTISCGVATVGGGVRMDDGSFVADPDWCPGWDQRWAAEVAAFRPDVALLVLAWPGLGDRDIDGRWEGPCDDGYRRSYAGELERAASVLSATGARVLVATAPYFAADDPPPGVDRRVDCLNSLYRQAGAADGRAVLDLFAFACPEGRCRDDVDGVPLRPDRLHFTGPGASAAGRWLAPQVADEARRARGAAGTAAEATGP